MQGFTHLDEEGNAAMVDVGGKKATARRAVAQGKIQMSAECYAAVKAGTAKKGDVLGVARIAGIQATKQTAQLIPLCHTLLLEHSALEFECVDSLCTILARCTVQCTGPTGVEMEALTGVSVALLTIYDMCKAMDKSMIMGEICLLEKTGGKSGSYERGREKP